MVGALYLVEGTADGVLDVAREFTPRFDICGPGDVVLDLSGLTRLFGGPHALARAIDRRAAERGVRVATALAGTATAARLLARAGARGQGTGDRTIVEAGTEAEAVAPLPLALLAAIDAPAHEDLLSTFHRWGLRTLGDLAALPADEIAARLGPDGLRWHRLAAGRDLRPLRPAIPDERFEQALDLDWPIEGLEPLSFVLGRLLEPLAAHLERRGRGAARLHLRLHLVTRAVHERSLDLPSPMRDARTLRTLLLLDLESHPSPAAIDRVVVAADPTPARVLQFSLFQRPLPSPEQLSALGARLSALMGEGRCGSPAVVDSWRPGACAMTPFEPGSGIGDRGSGIREFMDERSDPGPRTPAMALRRFRCPIAVRVRVEDDRPIQVSIDRRGFSGGRVQACAGPWRTSGGWWAGPRTPGPGSRTPNPESRLTWDRDEWDVTLGDGVTYRIGRDRGTGAWCLEGLYD